MIKKQKTDVPTKLSHFRSGILSDEKTLFIRIHFYKLNLFESTFILALFFALSFARQPL